MTESWIPTEQINPDSKDIDLLETGDVLRRINAEDQKVAQAVEEAIPQITPVVDAIVDRLNAGGSLFYFGAGTSGRLGVLDAAECPPTFSTPKDLVQGFIAGGEVALREAVEGAEDSHDNGRKAFILSTAGRDDAVIGISASGGAPYVLGVMEAAREAGCVTVCITSNPEGKLAKAVEFPIVVETGPEVIAGSTRMKAGTAQKLILNMLSTATMVQLGKTYENLMVDVNPSNVKLRDRAVRIVSMLAGVDESAAKIALEKTKYQVKPAVLIAKGNVSLPEVLSLLCEAKGKLRVALENLTSATEGASV